jgi:hypothetical protein
MSIEHNDDLARAKDALTIFRLWEAAALPGPVPQHDGMYRSPFREERTPSFSITKGGRVWCDFGGDAAAKGGVWEFAQRCPCWAGAANDNAAMAKVLIEVSGIMPTRPRAAGAGETAAPAVDPRLERAAKTIERRERLSQAVDAAYARREAALRPGVEWRFLPAWPVFVAERYDEGRSVLLSDARRASELAKARGWPEEWVWELLDRELLSCPWERWSDPADQHARRQKAFRVDFPVVDQVGSELTVNLQPVGYHQRMYIPARGGERERKQWIFVPSFPKEAARSEFERKIVCCGLERGLKYEPGEGGMRATFLPPLPFVLGDLQRPRLLVLLEGQWDAITFFGACGWFHDTTPASGVAVFGIRGVQGMDVFLAYWSRWLRWHKPLAWVIAQNDPASLAWRQAPVVQPGELQVPSLADRLAHAGCRDVKLSWLRPNPTWGKDFNDYYRAGRPTLEAMWRWMDRVGVTGANGGWA